MPPPRTRLDPDGYYDRLGLQPSATQAEITAAYRMKARLLHPDVPITGNTAAFVAVKHAYDVLADRSRRVAYDQAARAAGLEAAKPEVMDTRPNRRANAASANAASANAASGNAASDNAASFRAGAADAAPLHRPHFSDLPVVVWVGMGAFLLFCVYQAVSHVLAPSPTVRSDIRPNAAVVAPLSPSAHRAVLYGPTPIRFPGTPNFYVTPAGTPAMLLRMENNEMVETAQLPPFSALQAVRFIRQTAMFEVLVDDRGNGFVRADHVTAGNAVAARRAYCSYNAGATPADGELLTIRGYGHAALNLENRAAQPAAVKLRDETGAIMLAVFLGPGGSVALDGLPEGSYRAEFAIGELWSRACNTFSAGMRARRMDQPLRLSEASRLVVAPETADAPSSEISDQVFDRN